jgi:hypothetical protein
MKKFTVLWVALLMISSVAFSQNLIDNPGFENWTGGQPDNWLADGGAITVSQNTANVQEGTSSCEVVFTSQDNQYLTSGSFAVEAGTPVFLSVYFYDNDPAGRARLCCIWEGADNYYGEYSEDLDAWQMISYEGLVPDGATSAEFQIRFYDVAASWDGDATVLVDNASFTSDNTIYPEPSNYPTNLAAAAAGVSANVSWTDATGDQLPQKYLLMASETNSFTAPVDGTPVEDDTDMSDGNAMINVSYGQEMASFGGLSAATTYYFTIFPYTNTGADIDYKTDGTAPTASVTMPDVSVISSVDFEDNTYGDWTTVNVSGDQVWDIQAYGNPGNCGRMSGFDGQPYANEDWAISPQINLDNYSEESFSFDNAMNYSGPAMELYISSDYNGDPSTANWDMIAFNASAGSWAYESSEIDLSSYSGTVNLGFKFTSTDTESATWEIDNLLITGVMSNNVNDEQLADIQIYPNPGTGIYQIDNSNFENLNINVYNVLGQFVNALESSESIISLDITTEENGIYLVQIIGDKTNKTVSILKK